MSLYLTRAFVDFELAFKRGFRDSYRWHQAVWEAFPERDGKSRDFLTRLDVKDRGFQLLILSQQKPARPGWSPEHEWETREVGERFFAAERFAFQLRANPTRKLRVDLPDGSRKKNGRRQAITDRDGLEQWLIRKGQAGGFACDASTLTIHPARKETFQKRGENGRLVGVVQGVEFRGSLTVVKRDVFEESFARGIGPAKAFGYGLLLLAPVSETAC